MRKRSPCPTLDVAIAPDSYDFRHDVELVKVLLWRMCRAWFYSCIPRQAMTEGSCRASCVCPPARPVDLSSGGGRAGLAVAGVGGHQRHADPKGPCCRKRSAHPNARSASLGGNGNHRAAPEPGDRQDGAGNRHPGDRHGPLRGAACRRLALDAGLGNPAGFLQGGSPGRGALAGAGFQEFRLPWLRRPRLVRSPPGRFLPTNRRGRLYQTCLPPTELRQTASVATGTSG